MLICQTDEKLPTDFILAIRWQLFIRWKIFYFDFPETISTIQKRGAT